MRPFLYLRSFTDRTRVFALWLALLSLWISVSALTTLRNAAAAERLDVLVLSSFRRDLPAQVSFERGLNRALAQPAASDKAGDVLVHYEFLDSPGLPAADVAEGLTALIAQKYRSLRFAAVLAWGKPAAEFAHRLRPTLGDPRLILMELSPSDAAKVIDPGRGDLVYGARPHNDEALKEALRLSRPERIVVIGDAATPASAVRLARFKESLTALQVTTPVEYWLDQPLDKVTLAAAQLPPDAMIFYLLMFSDGHGGAITPFDAARRITATATAPLFTVWESLMGSGAVGGAVFSSEAVGEDLGRGLRAIEQGEEPPAPASPMRKIYDGSQLHRWGWDKEMLPSGAVVINPSTSPLALYRREILAILICITALGAAAVVLARTVYSRNAALAALSKERALLTTHVQERTTELARSNAELEQFAYAVSHDLRQPLRTVASYVGLIRRGLGPNLTVDMASYINFALDGAKRMDAMIVGLLDYSRVGRQEEPPQAIALSAVVAEALEDLSVAIADRQAKITQDETLPTILGHRLELIRLFQNLISNAIKYTPAERRPDITISSIEGPEESVILIADRGVGVPAEQRERAFTMFQRLAPREFADGAGLGLALCRKIVAHHGGEIGLEDNPGGGLIVRIIFPKPSTRS